ncbi:MAG: hypothetical protein ABJA02_07925 [Acidobacteriota bacterium]
MLRWSRIMLVAVALITSASCAQPKVATPIETFKTYTKAIKQKDTTTMKLLLSDATIKMHEKEAKAQGVNVDDIVKRETLFNENQKTVEYREEKIDGDKATLQVKNSFNTWETVPFVREDGVWKIDKVGYADQMMKDIDDKNKAIDNVINGANGAVPNAPPTSATPF